LANFFNLTPQDYGSVLVFEDSGPGLNAALAANMQTVYIKSHCAVSPHTISATNYSYSSVLDALALFTKE
jgi:beta-phosphoglucomutase-like phosphatase (HAD superfamily)